MNLMLPVDLAADDSEADDGQNGKPVKRDERCTDVEKARELRPQNPQERTSGTASIQSTDSKQISARSTDVLII